MQRSGRAVILSLVTALGSAACAGRITSPATSPAAPVTVAESIGPLFADPAFANAHLSGLVRSLRTGETLFELNAGRLLVPASNQKLLTVAAAAWRLGWAYRFTTRVLATGPLLADGTLDGDLVVVGGGDPTINPRHPDRWGVLDEWAAQIAARGIKVVSGHLIGDDNAFAEPGWGSGWSWDDLSIGYGAPVSALQFHENQVEVTAGPGLAPGAPAIVTVSPAGSGLLLDNQVITVAADQPTRIDLQRLPGQTLLVASGQIGAGARPLARYAAVENPTHLFVQAFREALYRKGVFVAGSALDIDELPTPPDTSRAAALVIDQSPPLAAIVDPLLRWSRNEYAETLLWALSPAGEPASETAGLTALREALSELGVDPSLYAAFDGSGLSRYDMVTAESLVRVLTAVWNDPVLLEPYRAALPAPGQPGSLANRLKDTPAQGRVWAKTGSMFNIRSLAGYLVTSDDEPLAFAFLANNFTAPMSAVDAMMDEALLRLVMRNRPAAARPTASPR